VPDVHMPVNPDSKKSKMKTNKQEIDIKASKIFIKIILLTRNQIQMVNEHIWRRRNLHQNDDQLAQMKSSPSCDQL